MGGGLYIYIFLIVQITKTLFQTPPPYLLVLSTITFALLV
jgi:hypothetical protein